MAISIRLKFVQFVPPPITPFAWSLPSGGSRAIGGKSYPMAEVSLRHGFGESPLKTTG